MEITLNIFNKSPRNDQIKLRDIRNQDDIRNNMYTNHVISKIEHLEWIAANKDKPFYLVYLNNKSKKLIGFVGLKDLIKNKTSHWFFYLDKDSRGVIGMLLELEFIEHVFCFYSLKKLYCEVFESNISTINLHKKFGFIECNSLQKSCRGKRVITLCLDKKNWTETRGILTSKYEKIINKSSVRVVSK